MSEILPEDKPKLLIVSDTAMYGKDDLFYARAPVVSEILALSPLFSQITWIGFNRPDLVDNPSLSLVQDKNIKLIFLKKCGGDSFVDKLEVLLYTPWMLWMIAKEIFRHRVVYTRAPSSPAFLATLISFIIPGKIFWHKYAGNWVQETAPRFFTIQRDLLKRASNSTVTINGQWPGQPKHCLSFENPCLYTSDIEKGRQILQTKSFRDPLNFCFVGRLEAAKGVHWILQAFQQLKTNKRIGALHLVGDGPLMNECIQLSKSVDFTVEVHGFQNRTEVARIMANSHILLLPSAAEGFPKVIAEAANFGCIPMVSNVSCIGQYINHEENGFLLQTASLSHGALVKAINTLPDADKLQSIAKKASQLSNAFTYEYFVKRVTSKILQKVDP